ncbi:hypothetical protein BKA65DRAFT_550833 [Rhexocercosporidium sp. MPI-PUGE-AT-0058]|nr:hypothetical protein BKA65DRAFT_550833 [Rhexocercosporidium sp. MPI-PUGE-AT-0058]
MPPIRPKEHEWTQFELHTMLCLIAKGVHLEQRPNKRTDAPSITRANAYENFYSALNNAVHGKDFSSDIHKKEVTRMLDQMLADRKHVAGKGGLVERQRNGRVTRALRMAWNRSPAIDFDGTESEWNQVRKEKVMMQYKIERGLIEIPVEGTGVGGDTAMTGVDTMTQDIFWKEIGSAPVTSACRRRWRSKADGRNADLAPAVRISSLTQTNLDSFRVLPEKLRFSSKFDWATNPVTTRDGSRDNYANFERSIIDRPLKRAGLRTRDLSRSRGSEIAEGADKPDRMDLPYESYRHSTALREDPITPNNLIKRDYRSDNYTDDSRSSSTPGFVDDSSTAMDISPEVETPIFPASTIPRIQISGDGSPIRVFNESFEKEFQRSVQKDFSAVLERDLANDLNKDVDMGGLEADLAAALESQSEQ